MMNTAYAIDVRSGHRVPASYEIGFKLGSGGMANVHYGIRRVAGQHARAIAVKVLHPHLACQRDFVDMFFDEARLSARVDHPNVVPIVEVGYEGNNVWAAMPYVEGESLGSLVKRARSVGLRVPLYAGGLDLVRGFPDNYVRTRALALANLEARFIAFDSTWLALVPTVFVDAIAARAPAGEPGTALSVGGGLRILVPKFVGTGLRVDLAVPVHASLRGVTEPEQRRFGPTTPSVDVGSVQPSFGVYQFF